MFIRLFKDEKTCNIFKTTHTNIAFIIMSYFLPCLQGFVVTCIAVESYFTNIIVILLVYQDISRFSSKFFSYFIKISQVYK